jgi:uncharacterized protein
VTARESVAADTRPFRALSISGGGMRGLYTAAYLGALASGFARQRDAENLDLASGFDLVAGTSTGAILACAIASRVPMQKVANLYRRHGPSIFPEQVPGSVLGVLRQMPRRSAINGRGKKALRNALADCFGTQTLAESYRKSGVALCIPSVNMRTRRAWVFKTPHVAGSNHRDDHYSLVDVCMASTAAPVFRSLESLPARDPQTHDVFVDGGLWANNPALVALVDAMQIAGPRPVEIYCAGNPSRLSGSLIDEADMDWGFRHWRMGADAADVSIDAQDFGILNIAKLLARHLRTECRIVEFPREPMRCDESDLVSLDNTTPEALRALTAQALADADRTNSICNDPTNTDGQLIRQLFDSMHTTSATENDHV